MKIIVQIWVEDCEEEEYKSPGNIKFNKVK